MLCIMKFLLGEEDMVCMHWCAKVGEEGEVGVLLGLCGRGKRRLSGDGKRK
ncbi:phosphoenolpyruvate carboxykinase (ATP), partial [Bacillus thuringiensis]|uniref:phosphoenolpyruvate carboxykinase (ATP) n=1 Tax=Bacillus thuringiensis TaxID=1428 RepID=UPI003C1301CD